MQRRHFLRGAAAAAATAAAPSVFASALGSERLSTSPPARPAQGFGLRYAPHFGMFRAHAGDDLVDQLRFMKDEGFTALEDNGMKGRDDATQDRVAAAMAEMDMAMGVFVAHVDMRNPTFVEPPAKARERIEADMKRSVEVAKRVNAKWCTVVPGAMKRNVPHEYQMANAIDNLRFAAEILEPAGPCRRPRAPQPLARSSRAHAARHAPGVHDLPGGRLALGQDPGRPLPPADHRGEPHPEPRPLLERDRLHPGRR